jgi:hypothetical protein
VADDSDEVIKFDHLEPPERYMHPEHLIQRDKARTANRLAMVLVGAVIGSLPLHLFAIWLIPDRFDRFASGFEKWLTIVGTLAGTAIGAYFGVQLERNNRGAKS